MSSDALEPVRASLDFWQRDDVETALDTCDIGALFRLIKRHVGASQTRIGITVGMPQSEISKIMKVGSGQRRVTALDVLARIANGLNMPDHARTILGLACRTSTSTSHDHDEPNLPPEAQTTATVGSPKNSPVVVDKMRKAETSVEGMSVHVRSDDGKVIWVPLSRRAFIALGAGVAIASSPSLPVPMDVSHLSALADSGANPIELLEATWSVLIDNDNLFGARSVIPLVEQQISLIRLLRGRRRGADRQQLLEIQGRYSEFCGWLYQDLGDFANATRAMHEALEAAHTSGNRDLTTYILARRSQLAGDMLDPVEAVDVAEAAEAAATPRSKLAAIAVTYAAHGYALQGDTVAAGTAYDRVHALNANADYDPDSPWGPWLDSAYVEAQRAHSLAALGDNRRAAELFRTAITQLPAGFHRDRGVYLARRGVALAGAEKPEEAASSGLQALAIGMTTRSARIVRQLARLDADLDKWPTLPAVAEFKDALSNAVIRSAISSKA